MRAAGRHMGDGARRDKIFGSLRGLSLLRHRRKSERGRALPFGDQGPDHPGRAVDAVGGPHELGSSAERRNHARRRRSQFALAAALVGRRKHSKAQKRSAGACLASATDSSESAASSISPLMVSIAPRAKPPGADVSLASLIRGPRVRRAMLRARDSPCIICSNVMPTRRFAAALDRRLAKHRCGFKRQSAGKLPFPKSAREHACNEICPRDLGLPPRSRASAKAFRCRTAPGPAIPTCRGRAPVHCIR